MREFCRVLKPDGWAIFLVPVQGEKTDEDASIVDPDERSIRWGQADHVRQYGADYVDQLSAAGFDVQVVSRQQLSDFLGIPDSS
jgi:hypothetical protein